AFFFSSRRRHTSWPRDWSSDVCSSDLTWSHSRQMTPVPWDFSQFEWGDTQLFDVRHRWVLTANYELPWGKTLSGVAHGFLSAWRSEERRVGKECRSGCWLYREKES